MNAQITKRPLSMRILAVLMSLFTVLTSLFSFSFSANATTSYVNYIDSTITGYKFASGITMTYTADKTYTKHHSDYPITVYKPNGNIAYCVAPGWRLYSNVALYDNDTQAYNYWNNLVKNNEDKYLERGIGLVLYYGYGGKKDVTGSYGNYKDRYVATQILVWEFVTRARDGMTFNRSDASIYNALSKPNKTAFDDAYNAIVNKCKEHLKIPSFAATKAKNAKTYTMKYNSSTNKFTVTIDDTNGVLSQYNGWTADKSGISVSKSGNKLTITSNGTISGTAAITGKKTVTDGASSNVVWGNGSQAQQILIDETPVDPLPVVLKVQTENVGNLNVEKMFLDSEGKSTTVNKEIYDNIRFLIKETGTDKYVKITGSNGSYKFNGVSIRTRADEIYNSTNFYMNLTYTGSYKFSITGLPANTYTVVEYKGFQSPYSKTGYVCEGYNYRKVTVQAGKTASINAKTGDTQKFINQPTEVDISKKFTGMTPTDKDYQGLRFQIKDSTGQIVKFTGPIEKDGDYVYQRYVSGSVATTTELKFKDKNSVIRVTGLPIYDGNSKVITYAIFESNDGSGKAANVTGSWFKSQTRQFTLISNTGSVSDIDAPKEVTMTNTPNPGQMEITKTLSYKSESGKTPLKDGDIKNNDGSGVTLQSIYDKIEFSVVNNATNKPVAVKRLDSVQGIYEVITSGTSDKIKLGSSSHKITIKGLPYGAYTVTETNSAGLKATPKSQTVTISKANITTAKSVAFENVYENNSGLRVYKRFVKSEGGEEIDINGYIFSTGVSFVIKDNNGNYLVADQVKSGLYTCKDHEVTSDISKATKFGFTKNSDGEFYFDVKDLPSQGTYTVIETMNEGGLIGNSFACEKSEDENGLTQHVAEYIPDLSYFRTMELTNVLRSSGLKIIKTSEDDDVERTFKVTASYTDNGETTEIGTYEITTERKEGEQGVYGYAELTGLPVRYVAKTSNIHVVDYKVEEINTPGRYIVPAAQTVQLVENNVIQVPTVTFKNDLKKATLNIVKTKVMNSGKTIPAEGIEFTLRNNYNDTVLTGTTNAEGKLSFKNLVARRYDAKTGSVIDIQYTLNEVKGKNNALFTIPEDLQVNAEDESKGRSFTFNVTRNQWTKTMEIENVEYSGSFSLSKVDADTTEPITNAEFTIQRVNDNGELIGEPITLVQGKSVNEETGEEAPNGVYSIDNLSMGKYVLIETKTPDGYYKIANNNTFELIKNNQFIIAYTDKQGTVKFVDSRDEAYTTYLVNKEADPDNTDLDFVYYNFPIKVNIKVYKENANKEREYLSGASFVMCEDTVTVNGKYDKGEGRIAQQNGVLKEGKASDGTPIYTINGLTIGNYYIVEQKAPEGFERIKACTPVVIDAEKLHELGVDGVYETLPVKNKEIVVSIKNKPIIGSLRFVKYDAKTNKRLTGAEFTLYVDNGDGIYNAEDDKLFDNAQLIADGDVPADATKITNGIVPESSEEGVFEVKGLPYGKYIIKETRPPYGYNENPNDYPFTITEQGQKASVYDVQKTEDDELVGAGGQTVPVGITDADGKVIEPAIANTPISANVSIYKYFLKNQSEELKNKTLTLVDKNYNVVATANVEGNIADFGNVKKGTYSLVADGDAGTSYSTIILSKTTNVTIDLAAVKTPLKGASFTLYNEDGSVKETKKSNAKGQVTFKEVYVGKYTIKETKAPQYYDASSEVFNVEVTKNQTFYFEAENKPSERPLIIKKESEDGVIENILFHVSGTNVFGQTVSFDARTDDKGYISKNIVPGTYTVTEDEKECADRYVYPAPQTIEVTLDHSDAEPAYVTVKNIIKKGSVDTIKVDADNPNTKLSGAEFTIYKKDGETAIGTLTEISGDTGHYKYEGKLNYGDYILKETKAPDGYVLDSKPYPFEIRVNGEVKRVETEFDNNIPNEKVRANVDSYKVDSKNPDKRLSGATLTVFTKNGKKVKDMTESTKKPGYYKATGLVVGEYYVQETAVPEGYNLNTKKYNFTVTKDDHKKTKHAGVEFESQSEKIIGIPDDEITGIVSVTKVDEEYPENKLTGAEFIVTKTDEARTVVGSLVEVETGIYKLGDLPYGDYYLKETKAPEGFLLDTKEHAFQIRQEGLEVPVETQAGVGLLNTPIYGSISIIKLDNKNEQPLEGAEFALYDANGREINRAVTDENGKIDFGQYRYGKYTVKELTAPENYKPSDKVYEFEIVKNAEPLQKIIPNNPQTGDLKVKKWAEDDIIEGVVFHVTGEPIEGYEVNEYITTGEDGYAYLYDLVVGEYTVEEVDQPDRYRPVAAQTVTVKANAIAEVTPEPEPEPKPEPEQEPEKIQEGQYLEIMTDKGPGEDIDEDTDDPVEPTDDPVEPTDDPVTEEERDYDVLFENFLKYGKVKVTKVDEDHPENKLTGAEFTVYADANGNGKFDEGEDTEICKLTETETGIYMSDDLAYGNYLLRETKAPKFYEGDDNYYAFSIIIDGAVVEVSNVEAEVEDDVTVDENGTVIDVDADTEADTETETDTDTETTEPVEKTEEETPVYFVNKRIPTDVLITKTDVSTGELLANCKMQILNEDKEVIFSDTTNENGEVWFKLLPGIYYYREYEAPVGYVLDDTPYKFEVKDTDEIVKCEMTNKVKEVDVLITKTDVSTGALLANCKMRILDKDQKTIFEGTTDKNGEVWFKLVPGVYYYQEYEAPVGYVLDSTPYKFEVKLGDEIVKCRMTNTPETPPPTPPTPPTPQTGDATTPMAIMIAFAMSGLAIVLFRKKRTSK